MMNSNSQLRTAARADLKGRWAEAAMLTFVLLLLMFFVSGIGSVIDLCVFGPGALNASATLDAQTLLRNQSSGTFSMLLSLLLIPVGWSFNITFLANHRHESDDPFGVGNLFTGYHHFWRVLGTMLLQSILVSLGTILFAVLLLVGQIVSMSSVAVLVLCVACGILAICFAIWMSLSLTLVSFILRDHPEMGIIDILRQSARMMDGHKWQYLLLQLSFLGWVLLGILTLFIGLLWVIPYVGQAQVNFYEQLRDEYAVEKQAE